MSTILKNILGISSFHERKVIIIQTTKDLVDELILSNTRNRPVKGGQVKTISLDMVKGNYIFTNQGIGIDTNGVITDGQHRLLANKAAGYPSIDLLIVTGLSKDAQAVVDRHARRSMADTVSLLLETTISTRIIATINTVEAVLISENGFTISKKNITPFDMADVLCEFGDEIKEIVQRSGSWPSTVHAAIFDYAKKTSLEQALDFADKLKSGSSLGENSPIFRLRETLLKNKATLSGTTQARALSYSLTVSACRSHSNNAEIKLLRQAVSWDGTKRWKTA